MMKSEGVMDLQFSVDGERCIGCGDCAGDCPYGIIVMQGCRPDIVKDRQGKCIGCQHCLAICPTGALSIGGFDPGRSTALAGNLPTAEKLAVLMQGRRSVRRYSGEAVAGDEIVFLLDTVAYAPTGVNNRQVLFTVIDDPQIMDEFRRTTYASLAVMVREGRMPPGMELFAAMIADAVASGKDHIFRGAPHLLIVSGPADSLSAEADCHIALSYFELLAAAMGLGTLWSGLAKWALTRVAPDLLRRLGVPESHEVGNMMVFGRPAVTYYRTVQRRDPRINRVMALTPERVPSDREDICRRAPGVSGDSCQNEV